MQINERRRELQTEAVDCLQDHNFNGFVIAPTGMGKAWILIECLKRIKPVGKIWYLCDSTENRDRSFPNEMIKWGAEKWIDQVEFMCYQTAYKREDENIELCLADEADYALTPEYIKGLQNNNFQHLVMVSATLDRSKRALAKSIVPIVFERNIKEIEDAKILNGARHHLVNFMLSDDENDEYLDYNRRFGKLLTGDTRRNQKQLEMLQIQRKHFLSSLATSKNVCRRLLKELHAIPGNKILVFCGLSSQADAICKFSYHSKSEVNHLQDFDLGKIRVLSVVGKIDRGVNLVGVNNIIMEAPSKSPTKFTQKTGRGRRLAANEILDVYYLVPYYTDNKGRISPTIVKRWVYEAASKTNFKPEIFKFND